MVLMLLILYYACIILVKITLVFIINKLALIYFFHPYIQSIKKLLLPPKYEKIKVPSNHSLMITIWEAIQKRSHEPIYKTHTKI